MKTHLHVFTLRTSRNRRLYLPIMFLMMGGVFLPLSPCPGQGIAFKVDTASLRLLQLNVDAGFLLLGSLGTGTLPATGSGTRFMWNPAQASLRAGHVTGSNWDLGSTGTASMALGYDVKASGNYAFAGGYGTTASGTASTATGYGTTAAGMYSSSAGLLTSADAYLAYTIGQYNVGGGTAGAWVATDPLFEVGHGAGPSATANAFTILKNGNIGIGTATPDTTLVVNGSIKITGGSPGAGKVLMSDANGLASWGTALTGGGPMNSIAYFAGTGGLAGNPGFVFDPMNTRVGISAMMPEFKLSLDIDGGIIAKGMHGSGASLITAGPGSRFIWYPRKSALRAGAAMTTEWNDLSIGNYSAAIGYNVLASGQYSFAAGQYAQATNTSAFAMGTGCTAGNNYATAMGFGTNATGPTATALGELTNATGMVTTSTGYITTASGDYSTSMGTYVSTNLMHGAFIIGDASGFTTTLNWAPNQMMMRFSGGYRLFTKSDTSTGVYMNGGASGWFSICDRNRKENHRALDGESVLRKIRNMAITEWNYKGADPSIRYIGPMAQDFWDAFRLTGMDSLGISSICIDGVNMAAIQALEKRTAGMRELEDELAVSVERIARLEDLVHRLETRVRDLEVRDRGR